MPDQINYEVRNPEIEELLKDIGSRISLAVSKYPEYGFALFIFGYTQPDLFYMSSARREDFIKMLREFIQKHEVN